VCHYFKTYLIIVKNSLTQIKLSKIARRVCMALFVIYDIPLITI
jgi:hypothetical protein